MLIKLGKSDYPRSPTRDQQLRLPSVGTGSLADRTEVKFDNQIAAASQGCDHLFIHLFNHLFIYLFIYLSIYVSIYPLTSVWMSPVFSPSSAPCPPARG